MSLDVNADTLGVGQRDADQVSSEWDTLDSVIVESMKEGFYPVNKPLFELPEVRPEDLSRSTPEAYAVLYTQLEHWQDYTTSTLAAIDGYLLQCENELSILATDIRTNIRKGSKDAQDKKPGEAVIADAVLSNFRYREVLHSQQYMQQKKLIVAATVKKINQRLRTVSRYIEIRKEAFGQGGRRLGI